MNAQENCHKLISRHKTLDFDRKPLPAMTICPMSGFKHKGFFHKVKDILENTINLTDIISVETYNATKSMIYDEPIAQQIGRCFSLKNDDGFELHTVFELYFKTSHDLKMFIHEKGDELWLTGYQVFPFEVASVTLDITKQQNFSLALLSVKEVTSVMHPKPEMTCKDYDVGSDNEHAKFSQCSKQSLWKNISSQINCSIADIKQIVPTNTTLKECNDSSEALNVYWLYIDLLADFITDPSKFGCPIPCRQTSYQIKINYYHKNNVILRQQQLETNSSGHFNLFVYYSSFTVEEKIESLEYDLANLLVSAGGNLGLFLGFSCLSVLFFVIDFFQAK